MDADCPDGWFCHSPSRTCVQCLVYTERCDPESGDVEVCEPPVMASGDISSGGTFEPMPCRATEVCVEQGDQATCQPRICEPYAFSCDPDDLGQERQCGPLGARWFSKECPSGKACSEGQCREIRSNVLLIFDTSSSMVDVKLPGMDCADSAEIPCDSDFPACDETDSALTPMDLAKEVFTSGILSAVDKHATFALQRFPMTESAGRTPNCRHGWYAARPDGVITGDDGSWVTEPEGWFDTHLAEALVTRFPTRPDGSTTDDLLSWLDRTERLTTTSVPCSQDVDCPSLRCEDTTEGRRCVTHSEHELRGDGGTPLGKSLFYAGEYLRRFVLVDGKACVESTDCASANYICRQGKCVDDYASCRRPTIVLFTDGVESDTNDDFFKAIHQAKRLRYGLGCVETADCAEGAQCSAGVCLPTAPSPSLSDYVAGDGGDAVRGPDGKPLGIRVYVVDLNAGSQGSAAVIAAHGGGLLYDVATDDPDTFREKVTSALQVDPKACDVP